jgi:hypothetical protein
MFVCYFRENAEYYSRTVHTILIRDPVHSAFQCILMVPPAPGVWDT